VAPTSSASSASAPAIAKAGEKAVPVPKKVSQISAKPMRRVLPPPKAQPAKMGPVVIAVLVIVLLGAGAFFAYQTFLKPSASVSPPPTGPKPAPAVSSSSTLEVKPVAPPAQPVNSASVIIDAHVTTPAPSPVVVMTPAPAAPSPPVSPPVEAKTSSVPSAPLPAPAIPAAQAVRIDLAPSDAASPAFKAFISNLHVNGVFQGEHPRVLIGNSTFYVGDVIDQDLGVVFTGIDPVRELALFKDSTGVTLVKKY